LAEDHNRPCWIRALLKRIEGTDVVGEASNGSEALELARRNNRIIVMMDISTRPERIGNNRGIEKELPRTVPSFFRCTRMTNTCRERYCERQVSLKRSATIN
jgi:DNA-binding NarL/FixJ family response regulator